MVLGLKLMVDKNKSIAFLLKTAQSRYPNFFIPKTETFG